MIITNNLSSFKTSDMLTVTKRENNKKRPFLLVNCYQAKHIPVSPEKAVYLFHETASITNNMYLNEKILIIGFAETATAIGAFIAQELSENSIYLQTTRENKDPKYKIIDFSEEHSHATEQRLYCKDWDLIIKNIDRIIFVEDEVTTGKTILNFIDALNASIHNKINIKYSVISIVNGMSPDSLNTYEERNIPVHYLIKIDNTNIIKDIIKYEDQISNDIQYNDIVQKEPRIIPIPGFVDTRLGVQIHKYKESCDLLSCKIYDLLQDSLLKSESILVLGTEELMFPAIIFAKNLKEEGYNVKVHATTRSPIVAIEDYKIKTRVKLRSLYCDSRSTYLYNLSNYSHVIVITDADITNGNGYKDLNSALLKFGNNNITFIRWIK